MSRLRYNRHNAVDHLRSQCDALGRFIANYGSCDIRVRREYYLFNALARAIVYQQLSGKAAAAIFARFKSLFAGDLPEAARVSQPSISPVKTVSSVSKALQAIKDLSEKSQDGTLVSMRSMSRLSDEQIVENLCQVRGIAPWTAQMMLIFNLGRPDVMPATDLGVQKGVQSIYRMR